MGRYRIIWTDTADAGLRKIILYVAANFGNAVALEKLDNIESGINILSDNPHEGIEPRYPVFPVEFHSIQIPRPPSPIRQPAPSSNALLSSVTFVSKSHP